jgi:acyltransferase
VALPLELDAALVAQIFVVLGFELHRHDVVERIGDASFGWVVALFAVGGCCAFLNGPVDMRVGRYDNVILYCGGSLATSLGLFLAVHGRAPNKVVEAIARNTIIIFPLHILVFSMFAALYVFVLHVPLAIRENAMVGFAASVANVAILVVMSPLFRKFFPWVYGAGGSRGPATIAPPVEAAAR